MEVQYPGEGVSTIVLGVISQGTAAKTGIAPLINQIIKWGSATAPGAGFGPGVGSFNVWGGASGAETPGSSQVGNTGTVTGGSQGSSTGGRSSAARNGANGKSSSLPTGAVTSGTWHRENTNDWMDLPACFFCCTSNYRRSIIELASYLEQNNLGLGVLTLIISMCYQNLEVVNRNPGLVQSDRNNSSATKAHSL